MTDKPGPLAGVRAVTCSTAQAGTVPYALMADLGTEVIKIELPGKGDKSRNSGAVSAYPSAYFETNNRGVKSLTLNLKTDEGLEILYKLVETADIFGQNFRPGSAEKNPATSPAAVPVAADPDEPSCVCIQGTTHGVE